MKERPKTPPPPSAPSQLVVEDTCGRCCWWSKTRGLPGQGFCYRFPPQLFVGSGHAGQRPLLPAETMACGEFEQSVAEAARPVGFAPPAPDAGEVAA